MALDVGSEGGYDLGRLEGERGGGGEDSTFGVWMIIQLFHEFVFMFCFWN